MLRLSKQPAGFRRWLPVYIIAVLSVFLWGIGGITQRQQSTVTTDPLNPYRLEQWDDLPGWQTDRLSEALPALRESCTALTRGEPARPVGPDGLGGRVADWLSPCEALQAVADGDDDALRAWLTTYFNPHSVYGPEGPDGLFTGYYIPEVRGSLTRTGPYQTPVYSVPTDLITARLADFRRDGEGAIIGRVEGGRLVPHFNRSEINAGALEGQGLEILWVDDPIDLFFLEIQGSGIAVLPDGSRRGVGYAGKNGHAYFAIGRTLLEEGHLTREEISLQSIKAWLRANPDRAQEVMELNRSYVFFQLNEDVRARGALNVPLTPGRSLAVDRRHVPLGAPLWVDITHPTDDAEEARVQRLMAAQDVGGAVTGVVRGDMFWGYGEEAEALAGPMRSLGRYWLILPKGTAPEG